MYVQNSEREINNFVTFIYGAILGLIRNFHTNEMTPEAGTIDLESIQVDKLNRPTGPRNGTLNG